MGFNSAFKGLILFSCYSGKSDAFVTRITVEAAKVKRCL